jgi:hypothetical protein
MDESLDEQYLRWLYSQVASLRLVNPSRTYWSLMRQLFAKEFVWLIANDDNRAEDGRELRSEFVEDYHVDIRDRNWWNSGCSVLEMLIGVSRRLAFEDDSRPRTWFWELLDNLEVSEFTDQYYRTHANAEEEIDDRLNTLIWRTYSPDGRGGLFPLRKPTADQREVEIWYQLNAYLLERE